MWLMPLFALYAAQATPLQSALALPSAVRNTLNQEYPGWKFAPVSPLVQQEFKKHRLNKLPSLVSGDFDRDGKTDYAVQIILTTPGQEEQIIIIFLARGEGYEENIVQSMGIDPTSYLWIAKKPLSETGPNAQEKLINKDVLMILGGPVNATTIAYLDGKVQEIRLPEDPDSPDPSIPQPPEAL